MVHHFPPISGKEQPRELYPNFGEISSRELPFDFIVRPEFPEFSVEWLALRKFDNRPRSIYQYSNIAPRLSGQTSIFGVVFFVSNCLLGIERQKKLEKFAILTRNEPSVNEPRVLVVKLNLR